MPIEALDLSKRSTNALKQAQIHTVGELLACDEETLRKIRNLGQKSVEEILETMAALSSQGLNKTLRERIAASDCFDEIKAYVECNELAVQDMAIVNRAKNQLTAASITCMSALIGMTRKELEAIPNMGAQSVESVWKAIDAYIEEHKASLEAILDNKAVSLSLPAARVREALLRLYQGREFYGFSIVEFRTLLAGVGLIEEETLKAVIGQLIADGELEYVDYRCYRVYASFEEVLARCPRVSDRDRVYLMRRLQGDTLEAVGKDDGEKSRERVRQVVRNTVKKVRDWYRAETGNAVFDEEFYRPLYETYRLDKQDAETWMGISARVFRVLEAMNVRRGKKPLDEAVEDRERLGLGLRLKIKSYLHRNKVFLDGEWIDRKRGELERVVMRRFFTEVTPYEEYFDRFNACLRTLGLPPDEKLDYAPKAYVSRRNRLAEARFLLWSYGEKLRYYDIDGRDYRELFEGLGLEALENIELSTAKLFREHPELMEAYDLRDHYELHNLLRKTVPAGSFHDFRCAHSPYILFGTFDRSAALRELLTECAPITTNELLAVMQEEYGYDPGVGSCYLEALSEYYHQGVYRVDRKEMPAEQFEQMRTLLREDFYWIDEIRRLYTATFPQGDPETVNSFNLKRMGFQVLSRYVLQRFDTLDAFFEDLLTREELYDIRVYRQRFQGLQTYYQKVLELKRRYAIVEYDPHRMITASRLSRHGLTEEAMRAFVDEVAAFVPDNTYFTLPSLRADGFTFDIDAYGFSDWFYASLLAADPRFCYGKMDGLMLLWKGQRTVSRQDFVASIVRLHGAVDVYDLLSELTTYYGCSFEGRGDMVWFAIEGGVYYDRVIDRLYGSETLYRQELERTEETL